MTDFKNGSVDPEQYWPDAEKLLDAHFRRKKRRRALLLLLLLMMVGQAIYFTDVLDKDASQLFTEKQDKASNEQSLDVIPGKLQAEAGPQAGANSHVLTGKTDLHSSTVKVLSGNTPVKEPSRNEKTTVKNDVGVRNKLLAAKKQKAGKAHTVKSTVPMKSAETPEQTLAPSTEDDYPSEAAESQCEDAGAEVAFAEMVSPDPAKAQMTLNVKQDSVALIKPNDDVDIKVRMSNDSARWGVLAYFGASSTAPIKYGNVSNAYEQRRKNEESPAILPCAGLQVSLQSGKWDLRAGFGYGVLGENVNYSPYSKGEYYLSRQEWQPFSYTQTDTDSAYIYGMLFYQTNLQTVTDSQLVNITDTINGLHYDPSLAAMNSNTRHYILQFPFDATWQIQSGRWGFGISAGLSLGIVLSSRGTYLLKDESATNTWKKDRSGQLFWQIGGGIECSYQISDRFCLMLAPQTRFALNPIREKDGANKFYNTVGINSGLRYRFR